eukprot:CAMPEP_0174710244 /NCGR_PEP_ID=MMETSP1094-20130205/11932_1 /TAXON_ID=156173 /ORGANISM="Chrysochromulina brevifilum, Strain UTEX LB 985" /LENGTH=59 /DNA_ID=CAMNT_0015909021 /DNA_START=1067 /DNA_END=1246 /DNA_ORIENTATION=-
MSAADSAVSRAPEETEVLPLERAWKIVSGRNWPFGCPFSDARCHCSEESRAPEEAQVLS